MKTDLLWSMRLLLMVNTFVKAISLHYFTFFKQSCLTVELLVRKYITHNSARNFFHTSPYAFKLLKYLCVIRNISIFKNNIFKAVVLYLLDVFTRLSFKMHYGIVVFSLLKTVMYTVLYLCVFIWFHKVCNVMIHLISSWFGSCLVTL